MVGARARSGYRMENQARHEGERGLSESVEVARR